MIFWWYVYHCFILFLSFGWFRHWRTLDSIPFLPMIALSPETPGFPVAEGTSSICRVRSGKALTGSETNCTVIIHLSENMIYKACTKFQGIQEHPWGIEGWFPWFIRHITGPLLGSTLGTAIYQRRARPRCDDCTAAWWNGRSLKTGCWDVPWS